MSKVIYTRGCNTLIHTNGEKCITSLLNTIQNHKRVIYKEISWRELVRSINPIISEKAKKIHIFSPNDKTNLIYTADEDLDFFITHGYGVITANKDITLIGHVKANGCCLIGLTSIDGKTRGIIYASTKSLNDNIIAKTIAAFAEYGVPKEQIVFYIGGISNLLHNDLNKAIKDNGINYENVANVFSQNFNDDNAHNVLLLARC